MLLDQTDARQCHLHRWLLAAAPTLDMTPLTPLHSAASKAALRPPAACVRGAHPCRSVFVPRASTYPDRPYSKADIAKCTCSLAPTSKLVCFNPFLTSWTIQHTETSRQATFSPNLAADIQVHPMSSAVAVSAGPSWRSNSMQQPRFKTTLTRDGDMVQVIETWRQNLHFPKHSGFSVIPMAAPTFTFSFSFPNPPRRKGKARHSGRSQAHPTETGPSTQSSL